MTITLAQNAKGYVALSIDDGNAVEGFEFISAMNDSQPIRLHIRNHKGEVTKRFRLEEEACPNGVEVEVGTSISLSTIAQNNLLANLNLALGLALGGPVCACDRRSAFLCPVHATKLPDPEPEDEPRGDDGAAWPQDRGPGMMSREEEDCRGYRRSAFESWRNR